MESLGNHYKHKIKSAEEVARLVGERPRQHKVIMCHGVFDVVHPGHLRHLLYAKSKADILVASLTADRHIAKGQYRPHVPQELRAINLAAFEIVDYVIIDPEPTPLKNLSLIKPDIFAKGYEYQASGLPLKTQSELDVIRGYGGEIIFTPGDYVFSSSQLIEASPPSLRIEKLVTLMESAELTFDKLRRVLDSLGGRRVHVVGDIIVDTFTHTSMIGGQTKTPTISVLFEKKTEYIGGAGVVAEHLRAAGAEVAFSTVLGEDPLKDFVLEGLSKSGVECRPVIDKTRPTTNKNAIISGGYRLLKVDTLDNRSISDEIVLSLAKAIATEKSEA
ncbi:MAG TPA: PfkB family carbohydrate kinase, partial [Xanthobacteraceae bacterium]|nr:PfkB family carbohydrate kinase [Xanthobacteraceae bacterium]